MFQFWPYIDTPVVTILKKNNSVKHETCERITEFQHKGPQQAMKKLGCWAMFHLPSGDWRVLSFVSSHQVKSRNTRKLGSHVKPHGLKTPCFQLFLLLGSARGFSLWWVQKILPTKPEQRLWIFQECGHAQL